MAESEDYDFIFTSAGHTRNGEVVEVYFERKDGTVKLVVPHRGQRLTFVIDGDLEEISSLFARAAAIK